MQQASQTLLYNVGFVEEMQQLVSHSRFTRK